MAITKITSSVVAANAIIAAGVAENSIGSSEIASNAVGTAQIASGAITTDMLDTNLDIAGTLDVTGVLTADSNVVIAGNLTVNGTTVTNSATNTTIEDALIELGTGTTGTPANDAGIVIERGDSDNAFMGWDESADGFILGTGSFTGASTGNLTISTAPLTIGALTASGIAYPTSDGSSGQYLKTDGAGTLTFANVGAVVNNYTTTGDGSTVAFDTGINPQDEVNTWVFVGGVYQPKNTYSYSGSTITFSEAPANGEDIDITTGTVASFDSADTVLGVYQATTTATDAYDTGLSAANENNTFVFLDGVYQPKTSYTFSGSTITFDANTPADMLLEVMATKTLSASAVTTGTIAANAVTSAKIASNAVLARHIAANAITGAEISSTSQITASTFTGALTGNVTGNVTGNLTGTVQTAAQTNITSVGTLSSLTVSGDLTVDTNTLYVDSTNNRVGVGTTSPSTNLDISVVGGMARVGGAAGNNLLQAYTGSVGAGIWAGGQTRLYTTGSMTLSTGATLTTSAPTGYTDAVTINSSGNVGIGTTPPTGVRTKIKGLAEATTLATSATSAALFIEPYSGSSWGLGIGSISGQKQYIQGVSAAGDSSRELLINPYGANVGIGTTSAVANLHISGAANNTYLRIDDGTEFLNVGVDSTGIFYNSNTTHRFLTNSGGTECLNIDSSGYIGISNTVASTVSGGYTNLVIGSGTAIDSGISIYNNTSGTGRIHFADGTSAGDRYDGFIAYKHNTRELLIGAGTAGSTVAYFSQYGFHPNPADQGSSTAANALDDYEEGTWTPSYAFDVGGTGVVYGSQGGTYVKIGQTVYVSFLLQVTSGLSASDYFLRLTGLPFNGSNVSQQRGRVWIQNPNSASFNLSVEGGSTSLLFYATNADADYARGDDVNGVRISGAFTYRAA